jgi:hypothetical protein
MYDGHKEMMYPRERVLVESPAFFTPPQKLLNGLLGILLVLLLLTFPVHAQNTDDHRHGNEAPGSRLPSDAEGNLFACQHGWAKCNHANLSPSEAVKVAVTDHQRNVSNCMAGINPAIRRN